MPPRDINEWLREARAILVGQYGERDAPVRITLTYADTSRGIEIVLSPDDGETRFVPTEDLPVRRVVVTTDSSLPVLGAVPAGTPAPLLRTVHTRLLAASTAEAETAERICRRAGMRCNSYTRTALTELVRWRRLLHTPDGYCLPPATPAASP